MPGGQVKLLYLNPDWEKQPLKKIASIDAADLFTQTIAPPKWVVNNLIIEGITILAGKPKIGKSWWSLDLALGIITGRETFGTYTGNQGEVLYLALEDNRAGLQKRLKKLQMSPSLRAKIG